MDGDSLNWETAKKKTWLEYGGMTGVDSGMLHGLKLERRSSKRNRV